MAPAFLLLLIYYLLRSIGVSDPNNKMLFNSSIFFLYLPCVFILYWSLSKKLLIQNLLIIIASYFFYGWWDWKFLILIFITSICSFFSGILIEKKKSKTLRRIFLWSNIILNIGILCLFKYYNFFVINLQNLLENFGLHLDDVTLNLILPVGISFYTFQALSYSIDVYKGKIDATKNIFAFLAFISFFPQLVAGPIERATNLLPQFLRKRNFDYSEAVDGCRQMLWGFFKKVVVADNCAPYVNKIFDNFNDYGAINLWAAAFCFSIQIYCDFSGYSDIAIGVSKFFGIKLMNNFRAPYFSRDIAEFWRKWHISLTTWFRDYIYIPLGGSRVKKRKVIRNTFVIFIISGLWHGAEWTFVGWGLYHSLLFIPLIALEKNRKYLDEPGKKFLPSISETFFMGITFILVMVGWIIFRSDNLTKAYHYIERMFTEWYKSPGLPSRLLLFWILLMLAVEWIERKKHHSFAIKGTGLMKFSVFRWSLYLGLTLICLFFGGQAGDFIYFQF